MAMALPVVASAVGAIPELVQHGHTGFLVETKYEQGGTVQVREREGKERS